MTDVEGLRKRVDKIDRVHETGRIMYDPPEVLDAVLDFLTDVEEKQLEAIVSKVNEHDENKPD